MLVAHLRLIDGDALAAWVDRREALEVAVYVARLVGGHAKLLGQMSLAPTLCRRCLFRKPGKHLRFQGVVFDKLRWSRLSVVHVSRWLRSVLYDLF